MVTSQDAKNELLSLLEKLSAQFENFPWENAQAYTHWMTQTYYYVRHTTCFLALTASRWGVHHRENQYHALAHLKEEDSHDLLLLNDLKFLGTSIEKHEEWPITQVFYQSQYYWIEHVSPAAHLGYAYLLEGLAFKKAALVHKKIVSGHGEGAGTFLRVHSEEDPHHFADGLKFLEKLKSEELEGFLLSLRQTYELYSQILVKAAKV